MTAPAADQSLPTSNGRTRWAACPRCAAARDLGALRLAAAARGHDHRAGAFEEPKMFALARHYQAATDCAAAARRSTSRSPPIGASPARPCRLAKPGHTGSWRACPESQTGGCRGGVVLPRPWRRARRRRREGIKVHGHWTLRSTTPTARPRRATSSRTRHTDDGSPCSPVCSATTTWTRSGASICNRSCGPVATNDLARSPTALVVTLPMSEFAHRHFGAVRLGHHDAGLQLFNVNTI
jgi:hypothetical protein